MASSELDDVEILDDTAADILNNIEEHYGEIGNRQRRHGGGGEGMVSRLNGERRRYRLDMVMRSDQVRRSILISIVVVILVVVIGSAITSTSYSNGGGARGGVGIDGWDGARNHSIATSNGDGNNDGKFQDGVVVGGEAGLSDIENSNLVASYQKYEPRWFDASSGWTGRSHQDATSFCSRQVSHMSESTMALCPYVAVCPNGPNENPLALEYAIEDDDYQMSPIVVSHDDDVDVSMNYSNGWNYVHLSGSTMCTAGPAPNDANDDVTKHVACCVSPAYVDLEMQIVAEEIIMNTGDATDDVPPIATSDGSSSSSSGPESSSSSLLVASYHEHEPQWFDRSTGWTGSTHGEALTFCSGKTSSITARPMTICTYDAMCPMGVHTTPAVLSSVQDENQRSPIVDDGGIWVYLGGEDRCVGKLWNATGDDTGGEDVTRNVMCCLPVEAAGEQVQIVDTESDGADDADDADPAYSPSDPYESVKARYRPTIYDRSNGWIGNTYNTAATWCASTMRNGERQALCPYEAYCPMGPHTVPYGGYAMDSSGGTAEPMMLAPLRNDIYYWVDIGNVNSCVLYDEMLGSDGTVNMDRILCCIADDTQIIGSVSVPNDASSIDSDDIWVPIPTTAAAVVADESMTSSSTAATTVPAMVDWGGVGLNSEMGPPTASATTVANAASDAAFVPSLVSADTLLSLVEKFSPSSWDRTSGWLGQTYSAALDFCSDIGGIPCPYEA